MNDNSLGRKMFLIQFHSVNVKRNWAQLAGKNWRPGARSLLYLGYHENILIVLSEKKLETSVLL